jgi:hypothetical protein
MTPPRLADKRVQHVQKNAGKEGSAPEPNVNCKTAVKTLAQGTARLTLNAMLDTGMWTINDEDVESLRDATDGHVNVHQPLAAQCGLYFQP